MSQRSTAPAPRARNHELEQLIGRLLQVGVLLATFVVILGEIALIVTHGADTADFRVFRGEPPNLTSLHAIVRGAFAIQSAAVAQLGLVLLIATPIARVALTLIAFVVQRDRIYVLLTVIVLAVLLYGLLG